MCHGHAKPLRAWFSSSIDSVLGFSGSGSVLVDIANVLLIVDTDFCVPFVVLLSLSTALGVE